MLLAWILQNPLSEFECWVEAIKKIVGQFQPMLEEFLTGKILYKLNYSRLGENQYRFAKFHFAFVGALLDVLLLIVQAEAKL